MYRAQQFFRALGARMGPPAWAEVEAVLAPAQVALFQRMPRHDQRHSLGVARTLRAAGHDHSDLLSAALLHDVAKSVGPLRLWHRVAIVLLKAFAPRWLTWLARKAEPDHWRYPFYMHRVHPEIGARWAEEVGCSSLTVWLITHHQSPPEPGGGGGKDIRGRLLAALRWADGQN
jgi:hypothetical protein